MIAALLGAVVAAVIALGPSSPDPVGDQMPIDLMEASTIHPFWTLPPAEVAAFERVAACESGWGTGYVDLVSASGTFRGPLMFSRTSWAGVGGQGDPVDADWPETVWRGHLLRAAQGWGAWPVCRRAVPA